jgi:hypothetical protein
MNHCQQVATVLKMRTAQRTVDGNKSGLHSRLLMPSLPRRRQRRLEVFDMLTSNHIATCITCRRGDAIEPVQMDAWTIRVECVRPRYFAVPRMLRVITFKKFDLTSQRYICHARERLLPRRPPLSVRFSARWIVKAGRRVRA